jgi:hypothetical protein
MIYHQYDVSCRMATSFLYAYGQLRDTGGLGYHGEEARQSVPQPLYGWPLYVRGLRRTVTIITRAHAYALPPLHSLIHTYTYTHTHSHTHTHIRTIFIYLSLALNASRQAASADGSWGARWAYDEAQTTMTFLVTCSALQHGWLGLGVSETGMALGPHARSSPRVRYDARKVGRERERERESVCVCVCV